MSCVSISLLAVSPSLPPSLPGPVTFLPRWHPQRPWSPAPPPAPSWSHHTAQGGCSCPSLPSDLLQGSPFLVPQRPLSFRHERAWPTVPGSAQSRCSGHRRLPAAPTPGLLYWWVSTCVGPRGKGDIPPVLGCGSLLSTSALTPRPLGRPPSPFPRPHGPAWLSTSGHETSSWNCSPTLPISGQNFH